MHDSGSGCIGAGGVYLDIYAYTIYMTWLALDGSNLLTTEVSEAF